MVEVYVSKGGQISEMLSQSASSPLSLAIVSATLQIFKSEVLNKAIAPAQSGPSRFITKIIRGSALTDFELKPLTPCFEHFHPEKRIRVLYLKVFGHFLLDR